MSIQNTKDEKDTSFLARYVWVGISAIGAILSFFINLYSDNVRSLVNWAWAQAALPWIIYAVILIASCYGVWATRGAMLRQHFEGQRIVEMSIRIETDDFVEDLPSNANVVGRRIHYLERVTDSRFLVIFLHGLGLDANDFRSYMQVAPEHTIAITQFGFNADEAHNPRYRPIDLKTHAELVAGVINNMQRRYPQKSIVLVGFSLGADMVLRLGELWRDYPDRRPRIAASLLLDPNINHSTMFLSSGVAHLNPANPLVELKIIAGLPSTLPEFQNICEYLHKISVKDLDHVRQYAADAVAYWEPDGFYDKFIDRINVLRATSDRIKVVFSFHYEDHFNDLLAQARQRKITPSFFVVEDVDHFDLLDGALLRAKIAELTTNRPVNRAGMNGGVPTQPNRLAQLRPKR